MAKSQKPGVVVAVLNMKGGVGKTTISAHVFRHLYLYLQKSTVLIDFDPQFNLTQTILSEAVYENYKAAKKTILSVMEDNAAPSIFKISDQLGPPPQLTDVGVLLRQMRHKPDINLTLVPGDFNLVRYSLIDDAKVLLPVKKRFLTFIEQTKEEKDVICIDCNPSSSFMTICALQAATHIIVPVRPDRYSMLGVKMLEQFIQQVPGLAKKPKLIILLNGVKASGYDPGVENSLRSDPEFGPVTMAASLHISKVLEASPAYTGFATDRSHSWRVTPRITKIVDELAKLLGLI